jgi:hypothetical protein
MIRSLEACIHERLAVIDEVIRGKSVEFPPAECRDDIKAKVAALEERMRLLEIAAIPVPVPVKPITVEEVQVKTEPLWIDAMKGLEIILPAPLPLLPTLVVAEPVEEVVEEEEEVEEEEVEEEVAEAEEAEEEEAEEVEEAEEALEVEQMFIRGRSYWVDVNTKKLYADVNEEVGDEIGALVNGKPVFLSPK